MGIYITPVSSPLILQYDIASSDTTAQENPLSLLPVASDAPFDSSRNQYDPLCLHDTRVAVLQEITSWADGQDRRCIFWLNGIAGTGKSTIARTIARKYDDKERLGASFFFSRGGGDVSHADKFFTSIASQLAYQSNALKGHICNAIARRHDIGRKGIRDQWSRLVLRPLSELQANSIQSPLLVVVDAMDECDKDDAIKIILECLAELNKQETSRLRIFITSRPELAVRLGFRDMLEILHHDLVLHDVPRRIVDQDITLYLREQLKGIQLDAHTISRLTEKASGLFVWAATACRFIKKNTYFASNRLSRVLEGVTGERNPERELDQIYSKILSDSISEDCEEHEREQLFELFKQVVGSIVILLNPLSAVALGSLLDSSTLGTKQAKVNVEEILQNLHSVLVVPRSSADPIRLFHPSFRDFLLAKERCQNTTFWVDEKEGHQMLVDCCIRLMATSLKQDICGLHVPGII